MLLGSEATYCRRKVRYGTAEAAMEEAARLSKEEPFKLYTYRCPACDGFHVGRRRQGRSAGDETRRLPLAGGKARYKRFECKACGRVMTLKNKGLCVTCWRKSTRMPSGRQPVLGRARLDGTAVTQEMALEYARIGSMVAVKWARKFGVRSDALGDAAQLGAVAAMDAFARGGGYDRCVLTAVRYVRNSVRDQTLAATANPYTTADGRRLKRRTILFSELIPPGNIPVIEFICANSTWVA